MLECVHVVLSIVSNVSFSVPFNQITHPEKSCAGANLVRSMQIIPEEPSASAAGVCFCVCVCVCVCVCA